MAGVDKEPPVKYIEGSTVEADMSAGVDKEPPVKYILAKRRPRKPRAGVDREPPVKYIGGIQAGGIRDSWS